MNKVLIITYYWPPAGGPGVQRVLKFVKYLPEFGWEPIVLTVKKGEYPAIDESLAKEIPEGTKVYKSSSLEPMVLYKKFTGQSTEENLPVAVLTKSEGNWRSKLSRWIRLNLFIPDAKIGWRLTGVRAAKKIIETEKPDLIFSSSPPPTVHLIAKKLAAEYTIPWVADFRDPWTGIYYYSGQNRSKQAIALDEKLERSVNSAADKITAVNTDIVDMAEREKLVEITNGFDPEDFPQIETTEKNNLFTIKYMGTITARRNAPILIEALSQLSTQYKEMLNVEFVGNVDEKIKRTINEKLSDIKVNFIGYLDHYAALNRMASADLLLFLSNQGEGAEKILSGKIFEYLMLKIRVLGLGPVNGKAAKLLSGLNAGRMFDYSDSEGISNFICGEIDGWKIGKSKEAIKTEELKKFERKELTRKLSETFEEIL